MMSMQRPVTRSVKRPNSLRCGAPATTAGRVSRRGTVSTKTTRTTRKTRDLPPSLPTSRLPPPPRGQKQATHQNPAARPPFLAVLLLCLPLSSHRVELGDSARIEHQSHRQSLGHVVHPQGEGDEVPEAGPSVAAERDSDPHALREGVQRHHEHDQEHLVFVGNFAAIRRRFCVFNFYSDRSRA